MQKQPSFLKKHFWFGIAVSALLAGTACTTVDEAREAQNPKNSQRGERTATFSEYRFPQGTALALDDFEGIALDANPKIFQARQAVISAQLAVKDIRADYVPTIDAAASYTRKTNNTTKRGQSFHNDGYNQVGVTVDLLLWDFGKTDAKYRQAVENLVAAEKELRSAENLVRYNVRTAYFELCRSRELNIVAEQSVSQYREHLAQMRAKREAGKGTKYDCTKAEVDYNNALLQSISTENDVKTARANLNLALGFAETPNYEIGGSSMGTFSEGVEELMAIAREREPGLAALVAREKAASAYVDKTIADLYPTLGLSISATFDGEDLDMPKIWNILGAAKLAQNVFDGGRNERTIEDAVAKLRTARSKVAAYEQDLYAKLCTAVLTFTRSQKQRDVAVLSERAAWENFEIVTEQFNVGKASALDRTDAQVSLTQARAASVSAEYDLRESVAAIAYLIATDPQPPAAGE